MRVNVLATWNESVLFSGSVATPVRLRDVVPALDRDDTFVDAEGAILVPTDFACSDESIAKGGLRIEIPREPDPAWHRFDVRRAARFAAASAFVHVGLLVLSRFTTPPDREEVTRTHMELMSRLLAARVDTDTKETKVVDVAGTRAKGEEGLMDRQAALVEAAEFGMISIISHEFGVGDAFGSGHGGLGTDFATIRAGEWDDNASLREFRKLLTASSSLPIQSLDVSRRRFLVARDSNGKPIPACPITVTDTNQRIVTLRTLSSGRALLFPNAEGLVGDALFASFRCGGNAVSAAFRTDADDGVVQLDGNEPRENVPSTIDVGFALDTTGSMSEEITAFQSTIARVATQIRGVRVGLVEYKDRGDPFVTRVFGMTSDIPRFASLALSLSASGGGDEPEAVNAGLADAVHRLAWSETAPARLLFLIGDAPPHDYEPDMPRYADEARAASHAGIQVFTIAASGMDTFGQIVFRQVAQYTGGTEMFVLRGGAGPQSVGGGDPKTSCGGTQASYTTANLDSLIVSKIQTARAAIDGDALAIRGVGQDVAPACGHDK